MIDLTKLNGDKMTVNAELIQMIEETPDTVITLTNGKKIVVKESRIDVKEQVLLYRKDLLKSITITQEKEVR